MLIGDETRQNKTHVTVTCAKLLAWTNNYSNGPVGSYRI